MANGIYSAVSAATAQTRMLETVANNLANISTPAFKGERLAFSEVLSRAARARRPGALSFVGAAETRADLRQGPLRPTDDRLDLALEGPGFITLREGQKVVYSRGGPMRLRADGVLTDLEGREVLGRDVRPLRPGGASHELAIDADGTVRSGGSAVGALRLVEFDRPALLQRLGNNLMAAPASAAERAASGTQARQGHLETANVNVVSEVSSMIVASRAYETVHKLISTFRDVDTRAANDVGQER